MHLEIYAPEYKGDLKGLIQICHGMTEYMGRYVEFAKYFTSRGYIVFGNDIISHGHSTTPRSSCLYINDWNDTVKDMVSAREYVARKYPDLPIYLLGFSLGSFIVRTNADLTPYKKEILIGTGAQSAFLMKIMRTWIGKKYTGKMSCASDEIYDHILCSICPVNLSKAGLCYNAETNNIEDRIRDWIVEMPDLGFLFPVFNDRSTDIHGLLYYSKNAEQLRSTFVDELFGCETPLSAGGQRDSFNALVEETLGEDCAYDTVMNIHEKLNEWVESQKDSPEPAVLTKPEVKRLFEECGVEEEKMETFDQCYEATAGENASLMVSNITNTRRTEIKTPDVVIHVDPDRAALIETQIIDGRKCIVIPMEGDVEINGIHVTGSFSEDNAEEI